MTTSDLIGHRGGPPHVNFEAFDTGGRLLENNHVLLGR
jgi:hypothetical protein